MSNIHWLTCAGTLSYADTVLALPLVSFNTIIIMQYSVPNSRFSGLQGHHAGLRDRLSAFTRSLLDSLPPIPGLDESIVISPRRLHITLGVMSLTDATTNLAASASSTESAGVSSESPPQTVESALALLNQLKPKILEMLDGERLRVALEYVDIMRPDRGDLEKAHVMWIGPPREGDDAQRLKRISGWFRN